MMGAMMMVVQKKILDDSVDLQVPCAVINVERRPGMVGILQRTPVHGKTTVTEQPSGKSQMEAINYRDLNQQCQQNFAADASGGRILEACKHGIGARLPCEPGIGLSQRRQPEKPRAQQVKQAGEGHENPVQPGQNAIPLRVLQNLVVTGLVVVEKFGIGAVAAVVTKMAGPLERERCGKQRGVKPAKPFIGGLVGMEQIG